MYDKIFGMDGWLYRILNKLVECITLNAIFLITCIPIFTIGSATTALYAVTRDMTKGEGYLLSGYLKHFKANFKKATIVWLMMFVILLIIATDFWILDSENFAWVYWVKIVLMAVLILWYMVYTYIFPLIAKFENTIKNYMMNALIISMTRIVFTMLLLCLNMLPMLIWVIGGKALIYGVTFYLFMGYALTAWVNSHILEHIFKKYIKENEK